MSIDYQKCDMCKECFPDCGDNYPTSIEGTEKYICPECHSKWLEEKGIKLKICGHCGEAQDRNEEEEIKKELNPFGGE